MSGGPPTLYGPLGHLEYARRLVRARNGHLIQANRVTEAADIEARRHEDEALRLKVQLEALGFDPQPPTRAA